MAGLEAGPPYLIKVGVNQSKVETYLRDLGNLPEKIKQVEVEVNRMAALLRRSGLSVTANSTPLQAAVRRQVTSVRQAQTSALRAMEQVAQETQDDVADRLGRGLKRPGASSGRLEALTRSDRNRSTTRRYFGVGNLKLLERDRGVPYALAIEAGSRAAVGRRLTGFWGGPGGPRSFGAPSTTQRFYASSASAARAALAEAGDDGPVSGIVRRPIEAHRDYRKTVFYFKPQQKMAAALRRAYGSR